MLLAALTATPALKASYIYEVTSTYDVLDVKFKLPTFEQTVTNQTTFEAATWGGASPIVSFSVSGGPGSCVVPHRTISSGLCWAAENSFGGGNADFSPAFTGPGTWKGTFGPNTTTVTITQVADAPEPSTVILLLSGLSLLTLFAWHKPSRTQAGEHVPGKSTAPIQERSAPYAVASAAR